MVEAHSRGQSLQSFQSQPGSFASVLVSLPDLWNKGRLRAVFSHQGKQLHPVDFSIEDLQAFAIQTRCIREVEMRGEGKNLAEEITKGALQVVARQLGVGHIQADPHSGVLAELLDELRINEKVVKALAAEMPGVGRHGLGNDFHFASPGNSVQAIEQAFAQWLLFLGIKVAVF